MVGKVELIPISEGNRITVKENEKVIIGRGSSLGCNDKKISRHHAELLLKDSHTLWIKPTHANPVFYRASNGKTIQLQKDIERELKHGDQIGLLPSTYFFRVNFSTDENNNNDNKDSDEDSTHDWKQEKKSPQMREPSPDSWSPTRGYRRSLSNQDTSVFDFDEDANDVPIRTLTKRTSFEKKIVPNVEKKPDTPLAPAPASVKRIIVPRPSTDDQEDKSPDTSEKPRKLPKWMAGQTTPSSSVTKQTTPKSSYSRNSSNNNNTSTSAKRHLSFEGDSNSDFNESSNMSDIRSPLPTTSTEIKSPGRVLSKVPSSKSLDDDSADGFDSIPTKTTTSPIKRIKSGGKRRPPCQFGASCYRKNPMHRSEQSHPGDSDYEDSKQSYDNNDNDFDKPLCPFGKTCYRQNPQHKREFRH